MVVTKCLPYINNEIKFCNLLNHEDKRQKYFLRKMLKRQEEQRQAEEAMHKVCPYCFMQMPLTNVCDLCGYKA